MAQNRIIVILGTLGAGKTMLATWFADLYMNWNKNYCIYCNYHLNFPFMNLNALKDFEQVKTSPNLFILDEAYLNADARRSGSLVNIIQSRHIMQSRKKKADVILTAQMFETIDKRIRKLTSIIIEPEIIAWDQEGVPSAMRLNAFFTRTGKSKKIAVPLGNAPFLYDTEEIVEEIETDDMIKFYIKEFGDFEGTRNQLKTILKVDHGLKPSDAKMVADYIFDVEREQNAKEVYV